MSLTELPADMLISIFEQLPLSELSSMCQNNSKFRAICQREQLWQKRTENEFGHVPEKPDNLSWRDYYLSFFHSVPIYWNGDVIGTILINSENRQETIENLVKALDKHFHLDQLETVALFLNDSNPTHNVNGNMKPVFGLLYPELVAESVSLNLHEITKIVLTEEIPDFKTLHDLFRINKNNHQKLNRIIRNVLLTGLGHPPIYVDHNDGKPSLIVNTNEVQRVPGYIPCSELPLERLREIYSFIFGQTANFSNIYLCSEIIGYLKSIGHYHNL